MAQTCIRETTTMAQVTGIRAMIQDLAVFEKMPDGPEIDAERLFEAIVKESRLFSFHAEPNSTQITNDSDSNDSIGYMLATPLYSVLNNGQRGLFLEDLFVKPEHRGSGTGRQLLQTLCKFADSHGYAFINWHVLVWNKPAIAFYNKIGGVDLHKEFGVTSYRLYRAHMQQFVENLKSSHHNAQAAETTVKRLENTDDSTLAAVIEQIKELKKEKGRFMNLAAEGSDGTDLKAVTQYLKYPNCNIFCASSSLDGTCQGFASTYEAFSSWSGRVLIIDCVFIDPKYRKQGIGCALMNFLVEHAMSENMGRIQWWWNCNDEAMISLFDRIGALRLLEAEEWLDYRLNQEAVRKMFQ